VAGVISFYPAHPLKNPAAHSSRTLLRGGNPNPAGLKNQPGQSKSSPPAKLLCFAPSALVSAFPALLLGRTPRLAWWRVARGETLIFIQFPLEIGSRE